MKLPRMITEVERNDLKALTRRTLEIARPTKFELVTRVKAPALSNYGSNAEPDNFMPIDILVEVVRDTGLPLLLDEMARLCGYKLVPMDPEDAGEIGIDDVHDTHKQTSEAVSAIASIARGVPDARRMALREIDEACISLVKARRKVAA